MFAYLQFKSLATIFLCGCVLFCAFLISANSLSASDDKFIRFLDKDANSPARLETAVNSYQHRVGIRVDLIAALHIGDEKYYQTLNRIFRSYDKVIYEGISSSQKLPQKLPQKNSSLMPNLPANLTLNLLCYREEVGQSENLTKSGLGLISLFQKFASQGLGLKYQNEVINYRASNLVHADIDFEDFAKLNEKHKENFLIFALRSLQIDNLRQSSDISFGEILQALNSENSEREIKRLFAKQMQELEELINEMEKKKGSVIIQERNKIVMQKLNQLISKGEKKIAIFYGAGHMRDFHRRLLNNSFSLRKKNWLTAWLIK